MKTYWEQNKKVRKVILSLELLTDFPKELFTKTELQNLFDSFNLEDANATLEVLRFSFRVVKNKNKNKSVGPKPVIFQPNFDTVIRRLKNK